MKHILRYGTHADKKFIDQKNNYYDTMLFNGNMIAYTPKAISKFINSNLLNKSFFIDPQTNAFQYSLKHIKSKGKNDKIPTLKKSYKKLLNNYGEKINKIISNKDRKLSIKDFNNDFIKNFSKNVMKFQYEKIFEYSKKENFTEFLNAKEKLKLRPEYLIIPYFSIDRTNTEWLKINKKLVNKSSEIFKENYKNIKLSAQLVITLDTLISNIDSIIKNYNDNKIKNVMLWIDNFNETDKSQAKLNAFANLIKKFCNNNIKVINLYGGYYSTILGHFEDALGFKIEGVSHGLEYGEYRKFAPVGGGIPKAKYYYYNIHKRFEPPTMNKVLEERKIISPEDYFEKICDCPICKKIITDKVESDFYIFLNNEFYTVKGQKGRRNYPSRETREVSLLHYLENKVKEFNNLKNMDSIKILIDHLERQYTIHKNKFLNDSKHLNRWICSLRDLKIR